MNQLVVSVVTPFHNTAKYLAECIESVLAQTYPSFEYILVDNCSTDGAGAIAESYARRDPRIRLIRQPALLPQVQNYNSALAKICGESLYCKVVQADDYIFPDCLRMMVHAFEQSETIGLVSAYDLKGSTVRGSGFPRGTTMLSGPETARLYLRDGVWVFGSPTTVMYRASLVREITAFYDESLLHEDTEKCLQILERWNFGFVHQVLSFLRTGNDSISSKASSFQPGLLDWYILIRRYSTVFFEAAEAAALVKTARRIYYSMLAHRAIRSWDPAFWRYHTDGLRTLPEALDWRYLALRIFRELLWMAANPGRTIAALWCRSKAGLHPAEHKCTAGD